MTVRKPKSNLDFGYAAAELFAVRETGQGEEEGWDWWDDDDEDGGRRKEKRRRKGGVDPAAAATANANVDVASGGDGGGDDSPVGGWTPLRGSGEGVVVYMDFAQGRHTWGIAQHRALEAVLTRYPEARIVMLQVAPGAFLGGVLGWLVSGMCVCFVRYGVGSGLSDLTGVSKH